MRELSYKDTEREIEVKIFDLEFKISNKIEKINTEEIQKQAETDEKIIEKIIDDILGENATKKINEKRVQDGYEVMSLDVQTQVLKPVENTVNNIQKYSNDYRRNRKFNNRYRRY